MGLKDVILKSMAKKTTWMAADQVLALYQEQYFDFSVLHFREKLGKEHGMKASYTWVKQPGWCSGGEARFSLQATRTPAIAGNAAYRSQQTCATG